MTDTPTPERRLMSTSQAAKKLATSPTTLRRMFHNGELPAVRVGGLLKFYEHDLDAYLDANTIRNSKREPAAPIIRRRAHDISDLEARYPHLAS